MFTLQKTVLHLMKSKNEIVRQYMSRLINAFASLCDGKWKWFLTKCLHFKQRRLVLFVPIFLFFFLKPVCTSESEKNLAGPKSNSLIINTHPSNALGGTIMCKKNRLEFKVWSWISCACGFICPPQTFYGHLPFYEKHTF